MKDKPICQPSPNVEVVVTCVHQTLNRFFFIGSQFLREQITLWCPLEQDSLLVRSLNWVNSYPMDRSSLLCGRYFWSSHNASVAWRATAKAHHDQSALWTTGIAYERIRISQQQLEIRLRLQTILTAFHVLGSITSRCSGIPSTALHSFVTSTCWKDLIIVMSYHGCQAYSWTNFAHFMTFLAFI